MQLFRALKTKGNTPKYGLIYHSSFIGRAAAKNKVRHAAARLRMNALGDADGSRFGLSPGSIVMYQSEWSWCGVANV